MLLPILLVVLFENLRCDFKILFHSNSYSQYCCSKRNQIERQFKPFFQADSCEGDFRVWPWEIGVTNTITIAKLVDSLELGCSNCGTVPGKEIVVVV
jgi:hypothetical protein